MGKQFTVKKDFHSVRYVLALPGYFKGGETVTLTDADYAALPASLTRSVNLGSVATVADPTYPVYPFGAGWH